MRVVKFILAVILGIILSIAAILILSAFMDYQTAGLIGFGITILTVAIIMKIDFRSLRKAPAVSQERQRYLLFGGLLMSMNNESNKAFKIVKSSAREARDTLASTWGIEDRDDAVYVATHLSVANVHTYFADDVYRSLIKKGITDPTDEELKSLKLEHAQQPERVKHGIATYRTAEAKLLKIGYTEEELASIRTLAAWDYGRTAYIARYSAHAGYITEDEAWAHIIAAAENAAGTYDGWKQYLAAYVLGRCVAYCEFLNIGAGLLGDNSVYSRTPFKSQTSCEIPNERP